MTRKQFTKEKTGKKRLRMKELVNQTGLPKSTILYYLSKGLIPEPILTSPNMAYYDVTCVERIRLIRHLQHHHRMSLTEIKTVIEKNIQESDLSARLALNDLVFGHPDPKKPVSRQDFCKKTGLDDSQLSSLLKKKLLLPLAKDRFDSQDIAMGKTYANGLSWGIKADDLTYYVEFGEKIVAAEIELRNKITRNLPYDEDTDMTTMMVNNARMGRTYVIDRLFQHRIAKMKDIKQDDDDIEPKK